MKAAAMGMVGSPKPGPSVISQKVSALGLTTWNFLVCTTDLG